MSVKPKNPRRSGIHAPLPVIPQTHTHKPTAHPIFEKAYAYVSNTSEYNGEEMKFAIIPTARMGAEPPYCPVAYVFSAEMAFEITKALNAKYDKEHPPCAGCAAFGPPVWRGDVANERRELYSVGWYHFTGGIHPFKEKYLWCAAQNQERTPFLKDKTAGTTDNSLSYKKDLCKQDRRMDQDTVNFHLKCVAGRILTLVDAMVTNEVQNKAFKKYVKQEFREQFSRVFRFFHDPGAEQTLPEELAVAEKEF